MPLHRDVVRVDLEESARVVPLDDGACEYVGLEGITNKASPVKRRTRATGRARKGSRKAYGRGRYCNRLYQTSEAFAASSTCSTVTRFMHSMCTLLAQESLKHGEQGMPARRTTCWSPYGPVSAGSVGPKIATTGVPTAAARCIGPLSLAMTTGNADRAPRAGKGRSDPPDCVVPGQSSRFAHVRLRNPSTQRARTGGDG